MKQYQRRSLIAVVSGIVVFAVCASTLLYFAAQKLGRQLARDSNYIVKHIDAAVNERSKILSHLNSLSADSCNSDNLIEMRRALFDAQYVIDIGFFKNDELMCTTGAGKLAKTIPDNPPDYIRADSNDNKPVRVRYEPQLYLLLFSDRAMEVIIVRQGNYNLIIDSRAFNDKVIVSTQWEVLYKNSDNIFHLGGVEGTYKQVKTNAFLAYESVIKCSNHNPGYCAAVRLPWSQFFANNQFLLIISLILISLAGVSSGLLIDYSLAARRSTVTRVRKGLKKGSFYWTYQPIICLHTGNVVGCEALARFEDKYGVLFPDQFIPIIRKTNLTWRFTQAMIEKVLCELTPIEALPRHFKVSINIFPCDVETGNIALLKDIPALTDSRFIICLEITEDEYLDSTVAHTHFKNLVEAGFNLSIDDFGTGYSNLKNLQNLSFHQLKIDRTFVQDIATEGLKASMIPNIMALVRKFNYTCVAEGIETNEQEAILKQAGVHYGQGWKYAKPMALREFKAYLKLQSV
ncbi:cyclic diguanylate phosphodiesterase [Pseudoalteromonas sp. S3776]|uniref:EAL domain-containing protein n=1 Tax=Pseudoalteromonas sp. S3776 TaxID=579544 RepID=UPI001108B0B1|nr:EAL domain-containing protein [Pseudoalteromonas sp. S3776]TMO78688.1 cyclic diguanylate phosphodiesterase [Pseudoalteromonas sp. S3776]